MPANDIEGEELAAVSIGKIRMLDCDDLLKELGPDVALVVDANGRVLDYVPNPYRSSDHERSDDDSR